LQQYSIFPWPVSHKSLIFLAYETQTENLKLRLAIKVLH